MLILLNGKETELSDSISLQGLISELKVEGKRIAIEVNQEIVPRSTFPTYRLKEGDEVEIVHAIGGG